MKRSDKLTIDLSINYENASTKGYLYVADYNYSPSTGISFELKDRLEKGCILGSPALKGGTKQGIYGLYEPYTSIDISKRPKIDTTLTPENAKERGYIWYQDAHYDPYEDPEEVIESMREAMKDGWLIGAAAGNMAYGVGLYKLLTQ